MNKTKKIIFGSCIGLTSAALVLIGIYGPKPEDKNLSLQINEEYKVEGTNDAVNAMEEILQEFDMVGAIKVVDTNIANTDNKEDADKMVYSLLDSTSDYVYGDLQLQSILGYLREHKVRPAQIEAFMSKSEDKQMKLVYEKLKDAMIVFELGEKESYINENFLTRINPDYQAFLDKYKNYLSDEFKDYLTLQINTTWNIVKTSEGGYNFDKVTNNLVRYDEFLRRYPESKYSKEIREFLEFQYQGYFGYIPGSKVFDALEYEVSQAALESYKKNASLNLPLGEKSVMMLAGLEASGNKMTPELLRIVEEIAEVNAENAFYYWYEIFNVEIPFEGADGYNLETVTGTYEIDPETGEIIGEIDPETGELLENSVETEIEP